jgi:hypothetical protein
MEVMRGSDGLKLSPHHKNYMEDLESSDVTLAPTPKISDRSKSIVHLGELDKMAFQDNQSWKQLVKHIHKMVEYAEIEPIYHYLESVSWLRKFHRPLSSKKVRNDAKPESKTLQDADQESASIEKTQRSLLVKWLLDWSSDCETSIYFATCILVRLTKDDEILDTCLRKLFRVTMDTLTPPHPLLVRNLAWFCKQSPIKQQSNVLIYACGAFRNWSEIPETRHHILSNDMIPFFTSVVSDVSIRTMSGQSSQTTKSVEVVLEVTAVNSYARLISQIVVCLRNLNRNNELEYTPDLIQDLSKFLLKRNCMHGNDHVVLMIVKLLGYEEYYGSLSDLTRVSSIL